MPSAQPCCPSLPSCPCPTGATHGIIPEFHSHFSPGFAQDFLPPSLLCSCSALRGKGSQMCWGGSRQSPEFHPVPCADSLYILFEGEKKKPAESLREGWGPGTALAAPAPLGYEVLQAPCPQDGPAETHQHHPTGPQSLSWRWLEVSRPFEKTQLGSNTSTATAGIFGIFGSRVMCCIRSINIHTLQSVFVGWVSLHFKCI